MDDITFVVITADEGCSIYYTWDGTDPTDTSARYTEPIEVPEGNNILSIIVVNDKTKLTSEIYRTNFIYHAQPEVEIEEQRNVVTFIMYEVNKENAIEFKTQWHFLCNRKLRFHYIKKLRKDRTAADKKYVAYCDPPQAENLASEIHFYK